MSTPAHPDPALVPGGVPPTAPAAAGPVACTRKAYLQAMRQVAASVGVVASDGAAGRHGATVTAFCSVSADPPTVLICLRGESRIGAAVTANRVFTLHILPEDATPIASVFAGDHDGESGDRFGRIDLVEMPGLAPAITRSVSLACRVIHSQRHESHVVLFRRVAAIHQRTLSPLLYRDGRYRALRAADTTA